MILALFNVYVCIRSGVSIVPLHCGHMIAETHPERRAARFALAVLAAVNLLNYVDRWMLAALVESVKAELRLSDVQLGLIASAFIVVYTATSPFFGMLGDRRARPPLVAFGVFLQSLAAVTTGLARGFWSLFASRAAVGIGEAAYGTIAPALLADHFALERRGRVLGLFFAAIPLGSAVGYILGGLVDHHFGWRTAWLVAGIPGLLVTFLVLRVADAPRGARDGVRSSVVTVKTEDLTPHGRRWTAAYAHLVRNRQYVLAVLGYAAYTFALGALAFWMPAFLERARGMTRQQATVTFGSIALVTGFVGTFAGGWLGDLLLRRTRQAYLWVAGVATLIAAPLTLVALTSRVPGIYLTAIVIAEVLVFLSTGPVNSAIINAVAPSERATALGLSVFTMHILGDIPSPPLIGAMSDATSLEQAFLIVPIAVLVAGCIWTYAAWRGDRDQFPESMSGVVNS